MKIKHFLLFLTAFTLLTVSCDNDNDNGDSGGSIPNGALPSEDFTLNNLDDEPYAESAKKYVAQDGYNAPFQSIELLPDGHYLMLADNDILAKSGKVTVAVSGNKLNIAKQSNRLTIKPTTTRSGNETITFGEGNEYGTFKKIGDNKYKLSNGAVLEIMEETGSTYTISYNDINGIEYNLIVNIPEKIVDDATRSLCRTWDINSLEVWGYINSAYMVHGKQTIRNGKASTEIKVSPNFDNEIDLDDYFDDDNEAAYQVVFTSYGTFITSYLDGETDLMLWNWFDKSRGILQYSDENGDNGDFGDCIVRFAGNQMRFYQDFSEIEHGLKARTIGVYTLTAKH